MKELENQARAALRWVDQFGDRDQDGYVEYKRRNVDTGIENQCWKDSGNSSQFSDGTLAQPRSPHARFRDTSMMQNADVRAWHVGSGMTLTWLIALRTRPPN